MTATSGDGRRVTQAGDQEGIAGGVATHRVETPMRVEPAAERRDLHTVTLDADLIVVGGGLAGTCGALDAARAGLRVVLVQDRPVLGGNASSEVRLWVLGATSHMGNNNRWAREGGTVDEILVENLWRNREGNALIFDTILLEKALAEPNLTVLLNTAAFEVTQDDPATIAGVSAFCSQNSTLYHLAAPLFCDASGDGILGFLSGAAFRMGAETEAEFGERFTPDEDYGELLGHSMYFYTKDAGRPVTFHPPAFALDDITQVPRYRSFNATTDGCRLWWIEYGGRHDTVHDTETIKWELWKVVYGVWDHIKNSGQFPEAANLTLEWVGHIPGKRESRRFEGDTWLIQQDLIEQRQHPDTVAFGGWSIDLHPADGVYSNKPGCTQWHAKGTYGIPYRCLYSKNITNLFLSGRIISASHVAFGSTRVMGTCSHGAQAVAQAAAICHRDRVLPRDVSHGERLTELQLRLQRLGQHLPDVVVADPDDLARQATVSASSTFRLGALPAGGAPVTLDVDRAQLLPLRPGALPRVTVMLDVAERTKLVAEWRVSGKPRNHTPDVVLATTSLALEPGAAQAVTLALDGRAEHTQYGFLCLPANPAVAVHTSDLRVTGLLAVARRRTQDPGADIGVEVFEIWTPERRPGGRNWAVQVDPPLAGFEPERVIDGVQRPVEQPHAWVAALDDREPTLTLHWEQPRTIRRVELRFDVDFDHPLESVLMGQPESALPFCVKRYELRDDHGRVLHRCDDNHQARQSIVWDEPVTVRQLSVVLLESWGPAPAALLEVGCFAD